MMLEPRPQRADGNVTASSSRPRRSRRLSLKGLLALGLCLAGTGLGFLLVRATQRTTNAGAVRQIVPADAPRWRRKELHQASVPEADVSGTVYGDQQRPIAGARVCASCATCEITEQPEMPCVLTGADGVYRLSAPGSRALLISASAEGFAAGEANGGLPVTTAGTPRRGLDIALQRGGARLSGVVVDALGGPVAHARVQLVRFEPTARPALELLADGEGRFNFWTTPGRVTLRAEADGYAPATAHRIAPSARVELSLTPESRLRGRVVMAGTRTPVPGVEVRAMPLRGAPRAAPARSGQAGEFELSHLDPGAYVLSAEADRWRGASATAIEVGLADFVENVIVEVNPAVSVIGHLLDAADGRACERGWATLEPPSLAASAMTKSELPATEIDADPRAVPFVHASVEAGGTVRFKGLTPGRYQAVLQCAGYVLKDGPELLEISEQNLEVTWTLSRGIGMTIRVVDAAGSPVPHAGLTFYTLREGRRGSDVASAMEADAHGRVEISRMLYPGTYTVRPYALPGEPVTVVLREGEEHVDVTVRLAGSGTILVDVQNAQGEPVSALHVAARRRGDTEPDPFRTRDTLAVELGDGRYRIGPLPPGPYSVDVEDAVNPPFQALGPRGATIDVVDGSTTLAHVKLASTAVLEGTVVDEKGQAQANVWVSASHEADPTYQGLKRFRQPPPRVITDEEGAFRLEGLAADVPLTVEASEPFGGMTKLRDVTAGRALRVVLPSPASVSGVVVDAQGRGIPRIDVRARHEDSGTERGAQPSGKDGRFQITGVPPGRVTLSAHGFRLSARQDLQLLSGQRLGGLRLVLASAQAQATVPAEPPAGSPTQAAAGSEASAAALAERAGDPAPSAR
jgi:hypothetical protein